MRGPSKCTKISELLLVLVLGTLDSFDKYLVGEAENNQKCISSFLLESILLFVYKCSTYGNKEENNAINHLSHL